MGRDRPLKRELQVSDKGGEEAEWAVREGGKRNIRSGREGPAEEVTLKLTLGGR